MDKVTEVVMDDMTLEVTKNIIEELKKENEFLREENEKLRRDYEEVFCRLDNLSGKCRKYETQAEIARIWIGYNELNDKYTEVLNENLRLLRGYREANELYNALNETSNDLLTIIENVECLVDEPTLFVSRKKLKRILSRKEEVVNDWRDKHASIKELYGNKES